MFLHWLVGMVFVFYMASFVLLLREVSIIYHRNNVDKRFSLTQIMLNLFCTGSSSWSFMVFTEYK